MEEPFKRNLFKWKRGKIKRGKYTTRDKKADFISFTKAFVLFFNVFITHVISDIFATQSSADDENLATFLSFAVIFNCPCSLVIKSYFFLWARNRRPIDFHRMKLKTWFPHLRLPPTPPLDRNDSKFKKSFQLIFGSEDRLHWRRVLW